jgi:cytochrome c biogenesis protein CcdA
MGAAQRGAMADAQEHKAVSVILGSVLAVPLFFVVFVIVFIAAYIVLSFLNSYEDGGITRLTELSVSIFAPIIAAFVARKALDAAFKSWNGWPTFILFIALNALMIWRVVDHQWQIDGWWQMSLYSVQMVVSIGAVYWWIARHADAD